MGYAITQLKTKFFLPKDNHNDALQAIKNLKGKETCLDSSGPHYSWVNNNFAEINNLKDMLKVWRWNPTYDDNGNINDLEFTGEKYGDCMILFTAIAPYVQPESFIKMVGEDGERWQWLFTKNTVLETPS